MLELEEEAVEEEAEEEGSASKTGHSFISNP